MKSQIEEIKNRIDIVEFLGQYISLKKAGKNFKANCPFHKEKTPSFIISSERQIWHCFGACQEGGDVIKFLMKWENITFFEAIKELAKRTGIILEDAYLQDDVERKKTRYFSINALAAEFFSFILRKTTYGKKAREYLIGRNIQEKTMVTFQIGYAPRSWNSLVKYFKKKGYSEKELIDVGLAVIGTKGSCYDRFRGRIMFPLKDMRGNTLGFSGRVLDDKEKTAKYINTPETILYHKRETLFGIHLAKETIRKERNVFLVEGEFDTISPYQIGIYNIVAIKGSAVTKEQLNLIKRYTERITFIFDTDVAGEEAMKRGIEEAENVGLEITIVSFDYAKDPDEAIQIDPIRFKQAIKKPIPIYDFIIEMMQKKFSIEDPFGKKKFIEETIPFLSTIKNPIVQSHYMRRLSNLLEVSESSIQRYINTWERKKKFRSRFSFQKKQSDGIKREMKIQKYLLSLFLQNGYSSEMMERVFSIIKPSDFSTIAYQKILSIFLEYKKEEKSGFNVNNFVRMLSFELRPVFDELYLYASSEENREKIPIEKLAYEIKRYALKRAININLSQEEKANMSETENKLAILNNELKEVEKKLNSL